MDVINALEIVNALADGVDPYTGEVLPKNSPYQHPDTVRALYMAVKALERLERYRKRQKSLPENAGNPWSQEEEYRLIAAYDSGFSIKELASRHRRTEGAITSRLTKLGRIELSQ